MREKCPGERNEMSEIIKDGTLYRDAPEDERSEQEKACYDFLGNVGAEYIRLDHEKAWSCIKALYEIPVETHQYHHPIFLPPELRRRTQPDN